MSLFLCAVFTFLILGKKRSQKGKVIKQTYLLKWLCRFRFMNQSIYIRHFLTSTQPKNPDKIITLVVTICDFKLYMSVSNWWCLRNLLSHDVGFHLHITSSSTFVLITLSHCLHRSMHHALRGKDSSTREKEQLSRNSLWVHLLTYCLIQRSHACNRWLVA